MDSQIYSMLADLGFDRAMVDAMVSVLAIVTILTLLLAVPTGIIAHRNGRSAASWVIFALCVPLLPLVIVWLLPKKKKA
jgi:ABC-type spermidine/putrescine transport system permease subunit I